jgi:hypothetical protein
MRTLLFVVPALISAGLAAAQGADRPNPLDPRVKTPPVEYRSAFDGYRPFAGQELRDWRKANEEVREAGGHAGHKPGQSAGEKTSKPQPGHKGHHK